MKYVGSKARFAKELLPIILPCRDSDTTYVEPFCGGCNIIDKVENPRMANDAHPYLIAMWEALVEESWQPPYSVSEKVYKAVQSRPEAFPAHVVGYIGFNSYGAKWFGGYRRDSKGKRDYWDEHRRNIMRQVPQLQGATFSNLPYRELVIPPKSIIYCDPPYANSLNYTTGEFDHEEFWAWVRARSREGHRVYVSEYAAPLDFDCVWEKTTNNTLARDTGAKQGVERLFVPAIQGG